MQTREPGRVAGPDTPILPATPGPGGQLTVVTPGGHATAVWARTLDAAPEVRLDELVPDGGTRQLVVVSAHPDDETIGAGRLIAEWARTLGTVRAITLTAGEASLAHVGVEVPDLGARRLEEWRAAVVEHGARPDGCWAVADGGVGLETAGLAGRLAQECRPGDVLLAPWRHDPHPDHAAAGEAAALAAHLSGARLVEYPVWMTFWTDPSILDRTDYRVVHIPVADSSDRARHGALAFYLTQSRPLLAGLSAVVPPEMLDHHGRQLALMPVGTTHG